MRGVLFAAAASGCLLLGCQAEAKLLGHETMIGSWHAGAYSDDGPGNRFSFCGGFANYNGARLGFVVTREYQWAVSIASLTFGLTKGANVHPRLALDDSPEETVTGYAHNQTLMEIRLAPNSELFTRVMRAGVLRVTFDKLYTFALEDTSKLLPHLLKCVRDQLNAPSFQAQSQSAQPTHASAPTAASPDLRAEVTSLAANLLSEAGVRGFKIVPSTNNLTSVTWTSPSGTGAFAVMLDPGIKRPSDLTPRLIAIAAEKCKGKFMSGAMPEENGAARAFSSCQIGTGEPASGYYVTVPRSSGGHYVIMTWPQANALKQPSGEEPDKDIRNAAYKVLR